MGFLRYILALLVTMSHLWTDVAGWSGVGAVFGFYVVSGYLMTSVLNESYGFSGHKLGRYFLNRFLRIYPTYWFVMLFAALVVWSIPREAYLTNFKLTMPKEILQWLPNLFIVGLLDGPLKVLVPTAWTLDIEIMFYLLMGLGFSRSRLTVTVWFGASLFYTLFLVLNGAEFADRYASYAAASLPFSIGAMLYMYRDLLRRLAMPLPIAWPLFLSVVVITRMEWLGDPRDVGFYLTLLTIIFLLLAVIHTDSRGWPKAWQSCDRFLGHLSYPIFLCHWQVAAVVLYLFHDSEPPGQGLWLSSVIFIHLVGTLVYFLVDRNISLVRDKVRGKERLNLNQLNKLRSAA